MACPTQAALDADLLWLPATPTCATDDEPLDSGDSLQNIPFAAYPCEGWAQDQPFHALNFQAGFDHTNTPTDNTTASRADYWIGDYHEQNAFDASFGEGASHAEPNAEDYFMPGAVLGTDLQLRE